MKYLHQQPIKQFLLVRLDLAPGQKLRAVDICGHLMLDGDRLKQFVLVANPDFESENTSFGDRSALFDQRLSARTRFSTVTQAKAAHLLTPPEWRISRTSGFGPFVTFVEYEIEDGTIANGRAGVTARLILLPKKRVADMRHLEPGGSPRCSRSERSALPWGRPMPGWASCRRAWMPLPSLLAPSSSLRRHTSASSRSVEHLSLSGAADAEVCGWRRSSLTGLTGGRPESN